MAHVRRLIYVEDRRGLGTKTDPIRMVSQLWTLDGDLVAEHDPHTSEMYAHPERVLSQKEFL